MTFEELLTEDARLRRNIEHLKKMKDELYENYLKECEMFRNLTAQREDLWNSFQDNTHYRLPPKMDTIQ